MVRLAIAGNPAFAASDLEVVREGPTYTVDTLRQVQAQEPPGTELFFICGQDSLRDLPRWHRPTDLAALCTLVVAPRPGAEAATPASIQALLPGAKLRCRVLRSPLIGISGTELRRRLASGESVRYWLPPGVLDYIKEHGLYASTSG
jgi:nicotinate-nucleotide adenylyltransferase